MVSFATSEGWNCKPAIFIHLDAPLIDTPISNTINNKNNDAIPTDYDDAKGNDEISQDDKIVSPREQYQQELNVIQSGSDTLE